MIFCLLWSHGSNFQHRPLWKPTTSHIRSRPILSKHIIRRNSDHPCNNISKGARSSDKTNQPLESSSIMCGSSCKPSTQWPNQRGIHTHRSTIHTHVLEKSLNHIPRSQFRALFSKDGHEQIWWVRSFRVGYPMEYYLSLHRTIDDLHKLHVGVLYLDVEQWQWWKWYRKVYKWYIAWTHFVQILSTCFEHDTHHLEC